MTAIGIVVPIMSGTIFAFTRTRIANRYAGKLLGLKVPVVAVGLAMLVLPIYALLLMVFSVANGSGVAPSPGIGRALIAVTNAGALGLMSLLALLMVSDLEGNEYSRASLVLASICLVSLCLPVVLVPIALAWNSLG